MPRMTQRRKEQVVIGRIVCEVGILGQEVSMVSASL